MIHIHCTMHHHLSKMDQQSLLRHHLEFAMMGSVNLLIRSLRTCSLFYVPCLPPDCFSTFWISTNSVRIVRISSVPAFFLFPFHSPPVLLSVESADFTRDSKNRHPRSDYLLSPDSTKVTFPKFGLVVVIFLPNIADGLWSIHVLSFTSFSNSA